MKLIPGVGFIPMLAYAHIAVKQITLKLKDHSLVFFCVCVFLMSHDSVYYLIWAGRLFHAVWCQLRWRPFGGFTGLELARLAVGAACWLVAQLEWLTKAEGFSFIWPFHVVWIFPSMVSVPRKRKQKLPGLWRLGLTSYRISLSLHLIIQSS